MSSLSSNPLRMAIVGYGQGGSELAAAIHEHPDCTLNAVVDPDAGRIYAARRDPNTRSAPSYTALEAFLRVHSEVDAVGICSPNHQHVPHALAALQAGFHVLLLPPLGLSSADAEELLDTAHKMDRHLLSGPAPAAIGTARWLAEVKDRFFSAEAGNPLLQVHLESFHRREAPFYQASNWRGRREQDGGLLYGPFLAEVQLLLTLFGQATPIGAHFHNRLLSGITEIEDGGQVLMAGPGGEAISLSYSTATGEPTPARQLRLIGTEGELCLAGPQFQAVRHNSLGAEIAPPEAADAASGAAFRDRLDALVQATQTGNPPDSLQQETASIALVEQAYALAPRQFTPSEPATA